MRGGAAAGLEWLDFLGTWRAHRLPIFVCGWSEDTHDPHNRVVPLLVGTFASRQNLRDWMVEKLPEMVNGGVATVPLQRPIALWSTKGRSAASRWFSGTSSRTYHWLGITPVAVPTQKPRRWPVHGGSAPARNSSTLGPLRRCSRQVPYR